MVEDNYMTCREAADYLRLTIRQIRVLVKEGKVRYARVTKHPKSQLRFKKEWLDAALEGDGEV